MAEGFQTELPYPELVGCWHGSFHHASPLTLWRWPGLTLPLLVLSLVAGSAQRAITRFFARHARAVNLAGDFR
jgi:hypothetical protein